VRRAALTLVLLACAAPEAARAFEAPAAWSNYAHVNRPASAVRLVVVHVAEGSFGGTVSWFRNPRARVSANYVVGREAEVAHMVPDSRVAWHAGNGWVNYHSIGVEHEGYAGLEGTFTDAQYRASAQLVASLLRRYHLRADRRHVIGHNEVPDPNRRGRYGGYSHHTDPGAYWDWRRYMEYVRSYRAGRTPPPPSLDVSIPGLSLGQLVTGTVEWSAATVGNVAGVDFLVDGVVQASVEGEPYVYEWDTSLETSGRHVLSVRAVGINGRTAVATVVVRSQTPPAPPPLVTLPDLSLVSGMVEVQPELSGGPVARVELWIDGVLTQTAEEEPWTLTWDATAATPGEHTLAVRAVGPRGKATAAIQVVTVAPPAAG
jgi:N-acetyl-anhydromuramyl-L-alanine amidase AmpD